MASRSPKPTPQDILTACRELPLPKLVEVKGWLDVLLQERREAHLVRKGRRVMDDLRGPLARAGISMDEFQSAMAGKSES